MIINYLFKPLRVEVCKCGPLFFSLLTLNCSIFLTFFLYSCLTECFFLRNKTYKWKHRCLFPNKINFISITFKLNFKIKMQKLKYCSCIKKIFVMFNIFLGCLIKHLLYIITHLCLNILVFMHKTVHRF